MRDLLPNGTLLSSRYKIEYPLGRGGFGVTYRALDTTMERVVAVKEFYPVEHAYREVSSKNLIVSKDKRAKFDRSIQRFLREGKLLARLTHPSIVAVYDLFQERQTAYLVMELIEGKTLRQKLDETPDKCFRAELVKQIAIEMVDVLSTIHQQDIYHLDIAPDNILLTPKNRLVLIDFGAARLGLSSETTQAFKLNYAPLEVISGEDVGDRSDLFELGVMLYEMLTGELPPTALVRVMQDDWQPSKLKEPWLSLLQSALKLRQEDRPATVKIWWENSKLKPDSAQKQQKFQQVKTQQPLSSAPTIDRKIDPPVAKKSPKFLLFAIPGLLGLLAIALPLVYPQLNFDRVAKKSPTDKKLKDDSDLPAVKPPLDRPEVKPEIPPKNPQPDPEITFNKQDFPKPNCGDTLPRDNNSYPLDFYPVFIKLSPANLNKIQLEFCQDAFRKQREAGQFSIQVASFISLNRAEAFRKFLEQEFTSAEVGQPTTYVNPNRIAQLEEYAWLSYRQVTEADLKNKSAWTLDIMRNEIYARRGRKFENEKLQAYFDRQSWYRPIYSPQEFNSVWLSPQEINNAKFILDYQKRHNLRYVIP